MKTGAAGRQNVEATILSTCEMTDLIARLCYDRASPFSKNWILQIRPPRL